jgi:predicted HTH domain antitoxin
MKVVMELPDDVIKILNIPKDELPSELRVHIALYLYEKGKLSFGKARQLSGLSVWEFMERLKDNQIPLKYDVEDLKEDLEIIKEL